MLGVPSFEKSMVMDSMFKFEYFGFINFNLEGSKFVHFKFMLKKSKKRDKMVEDLKNFGFTDDDTLWEKLNGKEIEKLHELYIK